MGSSLRKNLFSLIKNVKKNHFVYFTCERIEPTQGRMMHHGCKECMDLQAEFQKNPGGKPPRRMGLIIAGVVGGLGLGVTALTVPFLLPALRRVCLPFVPATNTQVELS